MSRRAPNGEAFGFAFFLFDEDSTQFTVALSIFAHSCRSLGLDFPSFLKDSPITTPQLVFKTYRPLRKSFNKLCVRHHNAHSAFTFSRPRSQNRTNPRILIF